MVGDLVEEDAESRGRFDIDPHDDTAPGVVHGALEMRRGRNAARLIEIAVALVVADRVLDAWPEAQRKGQRKLRVVQERSLRFGDEAVPGIDLRVLDAAEKPVARRRFVGESDSAAHDGR